MLRRSAVAAVAAILAAPPVAHAAWQAEAIPGTTGALATRSLAFDGRGTAAVLFEGYVQPARFTGLALRAPDGAWTRAANVPGIGFGSARVHLYATTRALLVTRQVTGYGAYHRARFRLVYALGRTQGGFGAYREIARSADVLASAANASGAALVAYTPQGQTGVRVSERRAGGRFARPRALSSGSAISPVVAINDAGDRVVAWYRGSRVEARVRRADGSWTAVRTVARVDRTASSSLRAAVTPSGRFVLAWQLLDVRESRPARVEVGAAIRPRGRGWRSALLERSVLGAQARLGEAAAIPLVNTRGDALVAWTGRWRAGTGVRIARLAPSGLVRDDALLSGEDHDAVLDDAAAGPESRVAVTYLEGSRTWAVVGAAPELLGEAALAGSRVAFSPLTGRPVVVRPFLSGSQAALGAATETP